MSGEIVLDLSRLIARADRTTPTGIDRVELAYARHLLDTAQARLRFAAMTPAGFVAGLPFGAARRYVEAVERLWSGAPAPGVDLGRLLPLRALAGEGPRLAPGGAGRDRTTYLLVSHHHLDRPKSVGGVLARTGGRLITLVHDLIPIQLPEYNRPEQAAKHAVRMRTVAELSDVVIVNSHDTGAALQPFLERAGRTPPVVSAALGVHATEGQAAPPDAGGGSEPYFVIVSTIEPRKNHLLLFNIWRRLAALATDEAPVPRLHVVGRRGWHDEAMLDVLERSTSLKPHLVERGPLSDGEVQRLVAGARALLMPSFAEGYGLPVAEALALGVPVLCSDLPALRAVGGDAPEYLDPLDGPAWLAAVRDYARPGSPRRAAQLARMTDWRTPTWAAHFAKVDPYVLGEG